MSDIYDLHRAAFSRVSAYVVTDKKGNRVATVALKYPADGAGRLFAYVHVLGMEMVRAFASGGGYDKRSAAVSAACEKISAKSKHSLDPATLPEGNRAGYIAMTMKTEKLAAKWRELAPTLDRGNDWTRALEAAGYRVLQAV